MRFALTFKLPFHDMRVSEAFAKSTKNKSKLRISGSLECEQHIQGRADLTENYME